MTQQAAHGHHDRPLRGIALRAGSAFALAIMFAAVKYAGERGVHIVEMLFYRQLFSLPVSVIALMLGPGLIGARTNAIGKHITRTTLGLTGMTLNFLAVMLLPLTEASAFGFMAPVFATILAALLLREHVGIHRWGAVLLGFAGVLIMLRPGSGGGHLPAIGIVVALAAAFATSLVTITLRQIGRTEAPITITFWFAALSLLPLGLLMLRFGQAHDPITLCIVAGMGMMGGIGQLGLTGALRYGSVSLVIAMDYTMLIWTAALGWLLWSNWPPLVTWAGAFIIMASGLYIAWREHVRLRAIRTAGPVS